jgi:hypothetical protein
LQVWDKKVGDKLVVIPDARGSQFLFTKFHDDDDDDEVRPMPDWETGYLGQMQQNVRVSLTTTAMLATSGCVD